MVENKRQAWGKPDDDAHARYKNHDPELEI
jgi:hypothetical protein